MRYSKFLNVLFCAAALCNAAHATDGRRPEGDVGHPGRAVVVEDADDWASLARFRDSIMRNATDTQWRSRFGDVLVSLPLAERGPTVDLVLPFLTDKIEDKERFDGLRSLCALPFAERKSAVDLVRVLLGNNGPWYGASLLDALATLPLAERRSAVILVYSLLASKDPWCSASMLKVLATLPFAERKPAVDCVRSLFVGSEDKDPSSRVNALKTLIRFPFAERAFVDCQRLRAKQNEVLRRAFAAWQ